MGFFGRLFGNKKSAHAEFTEKLAAAMQAIEPEARLTVDAESLEINVQLPGDDGVWLCRVHNIWEEAQRIGDIDAVIAAYAPRLMETNEVTAESVRDRLILKLQPRRIVEQARLEYGGDATDAMLLREITSDLFVMLALDYDTEIKSVRRERIEELGLTVEEAWDIALANVARPSDAGFEELVPGVYMSPWDDAYDGARLALPALLTAMVDFEGDLIAVAPTRYHLLLVDSADHAAQATLTPIVEAFMELDRPMQLTPLRLENGQWRAIDEDLDDDLNPELFALKRFQADLDYRFVERLVAAEHPSLGFVTPINVLPLGDVPCTMTGLPVGVAASLPEVDAVAFMDGDEPIIVPFNVLRLKLGDSLQAQDTWPTYYRMDSPPTLEAIHEMVETAHQIGVL